MVRLSNGLPCHAGSVKRLSPLAGATSDRPSPMATSSRPRAAAREATVPGCLARFSANLLQAVLGIIRSAMPTAELVNSRSKGAASSSAVVAATTVLILLVWQWFTARRNSLSVGPAEPRSATKSCSSLIASPPVMPLALFGMRRAVATRLSARLAIIGSVRDRFRRLFHRRGPQARRRCTGEHYERALGV